MKDSSAHRRSQRGRGPIVIASVAAVVLACLALLGVRPAAVWATPLIQEPATPTPLPGTGSVAGLIWDDRDGDGTLDPGEPGLGGVQVTARNLETDATAAVTSTADGKYRIPGLPPALYRITATTPGAYILTTQPAFDIAMVTGVVFTLNFGAWQPPTPTPSPTPRPLLDTSGTETLTCGGVYSGTTQAFANNVSRYACRPWWDESGREAVYRLQLTESQPVTITLLSASADLDLFLLRYAVPDSCVAGGDNYLAYDADAGAYFLSVDGYQGAQGSYQFRVDCSLDVQATATPTFTPSPTPTATQTGTPTPTPTAAPTLPAKRVYLPLVIRQTQSSGSILVTFTLQDGLNGYAGTTDTTLNYWEPAKAQGEAKILSLFYSLRAPTTQKAPVLRFDLSLLPPAADVQNATLRLYVPSTPLYDLRAEVQGLLRPWEEATATWELAAADQPWAQPGASAVGVDRGDWVSNQQQIVAGSRWYEFDVTPLVQQWARNPGSNYGFIMNARAGDAEASVEGRFVSREGVFSFRPQLVVSYTVAGR
jgi:hypothetical protein